MTSKKSSHTELLVVGPPGTGKTTFLAREVKNAVSNCDYPLIGSFTKAAAAEIAGRELPVPDEMVGTLHSHAFRALGMKRDDGIADSPEGINAWNEGHPGLSLSGGAKETDDLTEADMGPLWGNKWDLLLSEYNNLRSRMAPRETWPVQVVNFALRWEEWKARNGLRDFTDLIDHACEIFGPPCDKDGKPATMLIIDEAQDLSKLEMSLVKKWASAAGKLIIAGDPDQSIYSWRGADPKVFYKRPLSEANFRLLHQSYRVPSAVHTFAVDWISRDPTRQPAKYLPRDAVGEVLRSPATRRFPSPLMRLLERWLADGKSVMFLASCGYMLAPLIRMLRQEAIPYQNPYRLKNGRWNPLALVSPVSQEPTATGRLLSFLKLARNDQWTKADLLCWLEAVRVSEAFPDGAMAMYFVKYDLPDGPVDDSAMANLQALLGDDLMSGDARFYAEHLKARYRKATEFPIRVYQKWGQNALSDPQVIVGTGHSVKGGEADVVVVFPDLSLQGTKTWHNSASQAEVRRLFYVMFTRARETLVLCSPASSKSLSFQE